jgi:hypothetical protein
VCVCGVLYCTVHDITLLYMVYGCRPVAWEIAKNLALAGVGRMSVVADEGGFGGPGDKLMSYIQALNPSVQVELL